MPALIGACTFGCIAARAPARNDRGRASSRRAVVINARETADVALTLNRYRPQTTIVSTAVVAAIFLTPVAPTLANVPDRVLSPEEPGYLKDKRAHPEKYLYTERPDVAPVPAVAPTPAVTPGPSTPVKKAKKTPKASSPAMKPPSLQPKPPKRLSTPDLPPSELKKAPRGGREGSFVEKQRFGLSPQVLGGTVAVTFAYVTTTNAAFDPTLEKKVQSATSELGASWGSPPPNDPDANAASAQAWIDEWLIAKLSAEVAEANARDAQNWIDQWKRGEYDPVAVAEANAADAQDWINEWAAGLLLEEKREEDSTAKGNGSKPVTWLEKFMGSMFGGEE